LLVVLLAENRTALRFSRKDSQKELHHHRRDTFKEAWPEAPLKLLGKSGVGAYPEALFLGIQIRLRGGERNRAGHAMQGAQVVFERARVAVEILVRKKLQPVDEQADHAAIAPTGRLTHQA